MKICIIYATAGAGHRRAAEALCAGLKNLCDDEIVIVDSLDYTNPFYKRLYSDVYTFMITKIPWLWAACFDLIDIPWLLPVVRWMRRAQNWLHGRPLARFLMREQFDIVFATHFFPVEVAAYLKRNGRISSKVVSVVTDFDVHSIWISPGVDHYTVAIDWTKTKLASLGVPEDRITVTGIPVDPGFGSHTDIPALKKKLGLKEGIFTVLIATGSFGFGPIEQIIETLPEIQVIVICGHNKKLYRRLSSKPRGLVRVCNLVDNVDEWMAVSDMMISKPGGMSISEALVTGLPQIFFSPIPGQETNNIRVLKEHGVGISEYPVNKIPEVIGEYQTRPEKIEMARQKIKLLAKPDVNRIFYLTFISPE